MHEIKTVAGRFLAHHHNNCLPTFDQPSTKEKAAALCEQRLSKFFVSSVQSVLNDADREP